MEDEVVLNEGQRYIYDVLYQGYNTFIGGAAGTGKSTLIKKFVKDKENEGANVVVVAPTGIAAVNIGGSTIHRAFKYRTGPMLRDAKGDNELYNYSLWKTVDIIVIDEVSMLRVDLFDLICSQLVKSEANYNKRIQLILLGDFFQLPPVINNTDLKVLKQDEDYKNIDETGGFCFCSPLWRSIIEKQLLLEEVMRQSNKEYSENLEKVKLGNLEGYEWFNSHAKIGDTDNNAIVLCATNQEALDINLKNLDRIHCSRVSFNGTITEIIKGSNIQDNELPVEKYIELKEGARVMSLINGSEYRNGSLGTVLGIKESLAGPIVHVLFDNGNDVYIKPYTWEIVDYEVKDGKLKKIVLATYTQIPLKLAWAITIHKSQGQTYDRIILKIDRIFLEQQVYVGLGRCIGIEGVTLTGPLKKIGKPINKLVLRFYGFI